MIRRQLIALGQRQLVVRVERRRVAARAAFPLKDFTSGGSAWITSVRIRRRFERKDVFGQREQQVVGHPVEDLALRVGQDPVRSEIGAVATGHQRRVPHHVRRTTETMRAGVIDVLAILDADEIRHFRQVVRAAVEAREGTGRDAAEECTCLGLRHRFHAVVDVVARSRAWRTGASSRLPVNRQERTTRCLAPPARRARRRTAR